MAMRRVKTRGGRRGGFSGDSSFPGTVNPNVLALHRSRLMDIFPDINYQSAHILLDLCEANVVRAIDNVLYAQELRKNVLSVFGESRKLAFANLSDEQRNESTSQKPTEIPLIPSTSSGEHIMTQNESLQQQECRSESQASQFIEDVSINEELMNAVHYITEHVESSPNDPSSTSQQLQNEIINCELFYEGNTTPSVAQENKEHMKCEVYSDYIHAHSITEQQSQQTIVQSQKVNQRAGKVKIGQTTYVVKKLPKDVPLPALPSIAKNREILEKLVNQPMQKFKQLE
ncbi:uncharacterized protein LOC126236844 [Schistocerca nitens]|uniref:uncharacterized protein LOC126236844 n=1 Tax=Schistocerca nitens TaxID=7011 RepID=UPI002118A8C8|nr:uncharacterized protein LOC126236844 [Schistocerca nitens]